MTSPILASGAPGNVGTPLVEELLRLGAPVRIAARGRGHGVEGVTGAVCGLTEKPSGRDTFSVIRSSSGFLAGSWIATRPGTASPARRAWATPCLRSTGTWARWSLRRQPTDARVTRSSRRRSADRTFVRGPNWILGAFDRRLERSFAHARRCPPWGRFPQRIVLVRVVTSPDPLAYLFEELG